MKLHSCLPDGTHKQERWCCISMED